jgi:hypothetical protein
MKFEDDWRMGATIGIYGKQKKTKGSSLREQRGSSLELTRTKGSSLELSS